MKMEPVYTQNYEIKDNMVDCFGNRRPGQILFIARIWAPGTARSFR